MLKFKASFFILIFFTVQTIVSQTTEISGKVKSEKDVENIHVINKTAQLFTVTNSKGEFTISARLNDSIMFTSVQHKTKILVVTEHTISTKTHIVKLEELINELDQVTVGKILTGDLNSDIDNTEGDPPINFYDVGIPGYTGKIATQSERKFNEATTGPNGQKLKWYSPLTGAIPLNPIINGISGRTKMLKKRVAVERKADLLHKIKTSLSEDFFSIYKLDENLHADFFYFCEEDPDFELRCQNNSDIQVFEFLKEKLLQYKQNLSTKKE
tara:strand:+ start:1116 stop:1925 length:810 start_codon:yes stop_codon:yes gene_type:complete